MNYLETAIKAGLVFEINKIKPLEQVTQVHYVNGQPVLNNVNYQPVSDFNPFALQARMNQINAANAETQSQQKEQQNREQKLQDDQIKHQQNLEKTQLQHNLKQSGILTKSAQQNALQRKKDLGVDKKSIRQSMGLNPTKNPSTKVTSTPTTMSKKSALGT
jgi:hypothetical protein